MGPIKDFGDYARQLDLSAAASSYISGVRNTQPMRRPDSHGAGNCCYRFASRKLGFSLMAESHIEFRMMVRCEFDSNVLEFWEQPQTIGLVIVSRSGRRQRVNYTPDLLVLEKTRALIYEVKPESVCDELCGCRPHDWKRTASGFQYVPAQRYFAAAGIDHLVITEETLTTPLSENAMLLLRARSTQASADDEHILHRALTFLDRKGACTLAELADLSDTNDLTPLLRLIDARVLACNVSSSRLSSPSNCLVAMSQDHLDRAEAASSAWCASIGRMCTTDEVPTMRQMIVAGERFLDITSDARRTECSKRTLQRWRKALRKSNNDILALVPAYDKRGNRKPRLSDRDEQVLISSMQNHMLTPIALKPFRGYGLYLHDVSQLNALATTSTTSLIAVSFVTYLKYLRRLDRYKVAAKRGGARAANAAARPRDPRLKSLSASRPFQRAHTDHYLVDIHLVVFASGGKKYTKRAWLTVMVDEYSGSALAMGLSFRSPSRRACTTILRDCVIRHGRLPETVVVDNGSEFESVYFEACLARLGAHKQSRPPGDPRFGSSIERIFGVLKEELLLCLPGNTSNDARGRAVSASHRGQANAQWTLSALYDLLESYLFSHYNQHRHGTREKTPADALHDGLQHYSCSGLPTAMNVSFLVSTAIELGRGVVIDSSRGLRHNRRWYTDPLLYTVSDGRRVEIREEPWDERRLYACVGGTWVTCFSGSCTDRFDVITKSTMIQSIVQRETVDVLRVAKMDEQLSLAARLKEANFSLRVAPPLAVDAQTQGHIADPEEIATSGSTWARTQRLQSPTKGLTKLERRSSEG